jgi:hypothetical protein
VSVVSTPDGGLTAIHGQNLGAAASPAAQPSARRVEVRGSWIVAVGVEAFSVFSGAPGAYAQTRVAFIIDNSDYQHTSTDQP